MLREAAQEKRFKMFATHSNCAPLPLAFPREPENNLTFVHLQKRHYTQTRPHGALVYIWVTSFFLYTSSLKIICKINSSKLISILCETEDIFHIPGDSITLWFQWMIMEVWELPFRTEKGKLKIPLMKFLITLYCGFSYITDTQWFNEIQEMRVWSRKMWLDLDHS